MVFATVVTLFRSGTVALIALAQRGGDHVRYRLIDDVTMTPSGKGAPGTNFIQVVINWLGQYGLEASLATFVIGGAIYGFSTLGGNSVQASRGRSVVTAGAAGAVVIGLAATVINLLFHAANA